MNLLILEAKEVGKAYTKKVLYYTIQYCTVLDGDMMTGGMEYRNNLSVLVEGSAAK